MKSLHNTAGMIKKEPLTQDMIEHPEDYGLIDFSNFEIPDIDISELKIVDIEPKAEDAKKLTDIIQADDAE